MKKPLIDTLLKELKEASEVVELTQKEVKEIKDEIPNCHSPSDVMILLTRMKKIGKRLIYLKEFVKIKEGLIEEEREALLKKKVE